MAALAELAAAHRYLADHQAVRATHIGALGFCMGGRLAFLANAVLPAAEVLPHARRVAERFNALPPGAVRESKRLLRAPQQQAIADTIRCEGELFAARLRSPEAKEAFQAFFQKRRPDFTKF